MWTANIQNKFDSPLSGPLYVVASLRDAREGGGNMWGSDFALSGRLLHFVLPRALPWAGWLLPLRGAGGVGAHRQYTEATLLPFQGVCCTSFCPGRCPGLAGYCPFGARAGWVHIGNIRRQRFCPFRAFAARCSTQGVALGWLVIAPSGRGRDGCYNRSLPLRGICFWGVSGRGWF